MTKPLKVFVDSDVIISSILSSKGAAYDLVNMKGVSRYISNVSKEELAKVLKRKKIPIDKNKLVHITEDKHNLIDLKDSIDKIKEKYKDYVSDINDAHVVAGSVKSESRIITTYNTKHYNSEKIKRDLGINVMKPGNFLQYLRSK